MRNTKIIFVAICFLFLCVFLQSNEKTTAKCKNIDLKSNKVIKFSFAGLPKFSNNKTFSLTNNGTLNIKRYAASRGGGIPNVSAFATGIVCAIGGILMIAGGVPAWYLSAIGLGYITEHPGIVSVRPIDGNMGWLYLGYYGGISLIAVGSVLIAAGIALILVGLLTHGSRVKVFYKTDIKTASASMGLSFAL